MISAMSSVLFYAVLSQMSLAVNLFSGEGMVGNALRNAVTSIASPMQPAPEVRSSLFLGTYPSIPSKINIVLVLF